MNFSKSVSIVIIVLFILASCSKIDLLWDLAKFPEVETNAVATITDNSAKGAGNIINDGGAAILERGFCYSKSKNPTTIDNLVKSGNGKGTFFANLINLAPKTTYFLRAYCTNKVGISYGNEITFTTLGLASLTTMSVSSIKASSASSGGNIASDGGSSIISRGVCWGTAHNPTTANSKINNGTGVGSFTSIITGLTANTTYYVRAYATNSIGTEYGNEVSFSTLVKAALPTLTTTTISAITASSGTGGGNITDDGGAPVTERGVCWNTSTNPTIANSKTTTGNGTGSYTSSITGLLSNTTYYVRAYATNSSGTSYGNLVNFTTSPGLPTLTTTIVSAITTSTATGGGNITNSGGTNVTARGICYSITSNPTISNSKVASGTGTGIFTSNITGLSSNTLYYVRAYATNSAGITYGNEVVFTTNIVVLPTLTTSIITSITNISATSGGNVSSDGGSPVTSRGVCYNTVTNPTISNSIVSSGTGIGTFSSTITGLTLNTNYFVRAYATNSAGTAYGNELVFTTLTYALGQSFGGGIIFYVDASGLHGLISATSNQNYSIWGCYGSLLSGCDGTAIGTGQSNTTLIINGCATASIAARICDDLVLNGYSDWFLPSSNELNLMYQQRNSIGGFSTFVFWSSTQVSSTAAVVQSFSTGSQTNGNKSVSYYVRAIRAF